MYGGRAIGAFRTTGGKQRRTARMLLNWQSTRDLLWIWVGAVRGPAALPQSDDRGLWVSRA
jgi:hypothetical protein